LKYVAGITVQVDRVGAVAVGRDRDRAVVAVQSRFVFGSVWLAADGEVSGSRTEVERAAGRTDRDSAGETRGSGCAAAAERDRRRRDRVRPRREDLAVKHEGVGCEGDGDHAGDVRGVVLPVAADAESGFGGAVDGELSGATEVVSAFSRYRRHGRGDC